APFLRRRLREDPASARDVLDRLRPMLMTHPEDRQLSLAAAEACLTAGDPAAAWEHLQTLVQPDQAPAPACLQAVAMAGGSSQDLCRAISAFVVSRAPQWSARADVAFALAESCGRAGLLSEAVQGLHAAAAAAPEGAGICREALRVLARGASAASPEERANAAEALAASDDLPGAIEVLRDVRQIAPASASRLIARLHDPFRP